MKLPYLYILYYKFNQYQKKTSSFCIFKIFHLFYFPLIIAATKYSSKLSYMHKNVFHSAEQRKNGLIQSQWYDYEWHSMSQCEYELNFVHASVRPSPYLYLFWLILLFDEHQRVICIIKVVLLLMVAASGMYLWMDRWYPGSHLYTVVFWAFNAWLEISK